MIETSMATLRQNRLLRDYPVLTTLLPPDSNWWVMDEVAADADFFNRRLQQDLSGLRRFFSSLDAPLGASMVFADCESRMGELAKTGKRPISVRQWHSHTWGTIEEPGETVQEALVRLDKDYGRHPSLALLMERLPMDCYHITIYRAHDWKIMTLLERMRELFEPARESA